MIRAIGEFFQFIYWEFFKNRPMIRRFQRMTPAEQNDFIRKVRNGEINP